MSAHVVQEEDMASVPPVVSSTRETAFVARAAYALSALLLLLPLADITLGLFPLQFNNLRWRIGVTGMTTGALLLPITGLFLALSTAHLKGHYRARTILAVLAILGAVFLFTTAVLFTLDTLQLRSEIDQRGRHLYDRAAVKGILAQLLTATMLMFVGISSFRTAKAAGRSVRPRMESGPVPPVVGRPDVATGR